FRAAARHGGRGDEAQPDGGRRYPLGAGAPSHRITGRSDFEGAGVSSSPRWVSMKIEQLRWYIAALLFTATVINYIDRQALSIVAPVLTKELGISPIEYSNMLQAFLIAYTLMYLGSGFLVDKWGTRVSQACFMAWWSVSNVLHAFARNSTHLAAFR